MDRGKSNMGHIRQSSRREPGLAQQDRHEPLRFSVRRELFRLTQHLDPGSRSVSVTSFRFGKNNFRTEQLEISALRRPPFTGKLLMRENHDVSRRP